MVSLRAVSVQRRARSALDLRDASQRGRRLLPALVLRHDHSAEAPAVPARISRQYSPLTAQVIAAARSNACRFVVLSFALHGDSRPMLCRPLPVAYLAASCRSLYVSLLV